MADGFDAYVDDVLDGAVRALAAEGDALRALRRNDCTPRALAATTRVCRQARSGGLRGVALNRAQGICLQRVIAQRLCRGPRGGRRGADVRDEFRIGPGVGGDLLPRVGPVGQPRSVVESKHVDLDRVAPAGVLDVAALAARVQRAVAHVRRQVAALQARATGRAAAVPLPLQVRLVVGLSGLRGHPRRPAVVRQAAALVRAVVAGAAPPRPAVHVVDADPPTDRLLGAGAIGGRP